jgi:hypothetical protein
MATSLKNFTIIAALIFASTASQAEVLPDPTRPAVGSGVPQKGAATGEANAAPSDDGLRTIISSPDRRSVVINGRQVVLGGKLDNERLMAVCDASVVLQGPEGRREVPLYPGVEIRGGGQKRCNTAEKALPEAAGSVSGRKLDNISHKKPDGVAGKKESSK